MHTDLFGDAKTSQQSKQVVANYSTRRKRVSVLLMLTMITFLSFTFTGRFLFICLLFRPRNGSSMATNVVLDGVVIVIRVAI